MNNNHFNNRFTFDDDQHNERARIKVIGVGGGGGNAINNMIEKGLTNVEYIAINTDAQALKNNKAGITIQAGKNLTQGLGAGARPEIGREAVEENRHELEEAIESCDMIFVTAGMGGGTGTGGAPIVAGLAKRKGILTVGVVTTPFACEGKKRMQYAQTGIDELKKACDTVIVIPNERLMDISTEETTMVEAFEMANEVLFNATKGISDLILVPGFINVDFADVRTTMLDGGAAIMGSAVASGPERAEIAARGAIGSPLLDGISIRGARNVLLNISGPSTLGMREVNMAMGIVQQEAGEDAEIIMGTALEEDTDEVRVTVIATGFEVAEHKGRATIVAAPTRNRALGTANTSRTLDEFAQSPNIKRGPDLPQPPRRDADFYKGENNLKRLDRPAIDRNPITVRRTVEPEQNENRAFGLGQRTGTDRQVLLNNRPEGIEKGNSELPAFLRKIMD